MSGSKVQLPGKTEQFVPSSRAQLNQNMSAISEPMVGMTVVADVAPFAFVLLLLVSAAMQLIQATLCTATVTRHILLELGNLKCANSMWITKT